MALKKLAFLPVLLTLSLTGCVWDNLPIDKPVVTTNYDENNIIESVEVATGLKDIALCQDPDNPCVQMLPKGKDPVTGELLFFDNSYLQIGPGDANVMFTPLTIHMDIQDVNDLLANEVEFQDPAVFPGGRVIPGFCTEDENKVCQPDKVFLAFPVTLDKQQARSFEKEFVLYLNVGQEDKLVGAFIPANIDLADSLFEKVFYSKDKVAKFKFKLDKKPIGTVFVVNNDKNGENGGVMPLLNLKNLAQIVKKKAEKAQQQ